MIKVKTKGSFKRSQKFLLRMEKREQFKALKKYGPIGVTALRNATPQDSSQTANSWTYEVVDQPGYFAIHWYNTHLENPGRIPIAAIIQYGHATRGGGYVQGIDYINPAMRPIFEKIVDDMWKEVTK